MAQLQPLALLPPALIEAGYKSPSCPDLLQAAQAGWIPAEQGDDDQWFYNPDYLDFIAASLVLEPDAA